MSAGKPRAGRYERAAVAAVSIVWLLAFVVVDVLTRRQDVSFVVLFAVSPLIACAVLPWPPTAALAIVAEAIALASPAWDTGTPGSPGLYIVRVVDVAVIGATAVAISVARVARERRLVEVTTVASAAQAALLPVLPSRLGNVGLASRYRSAARAAAVGGDFYDTVAVAGRVRALTGDVRGKGLEAVANAARAVRVFRLYSGAESDLSKVAGAMSSALAPYLGDEDFITAVLVDVCDDEVAVVACGHPPPFVVRAGVFETVDVVSAPPLGLAERFGTTPPFSATTARWRPGDRLLLYTDGLIEARNRRGEFFAREAIAAAMSLGERERALDRLMTSLAEHVADGITDDLALLLLEFLAE